MCNTVNYQLKRLHKGAWKEEVLKIYVRTGDRMGIFDGFTDKKLLKELTYEEGEKLYSIGLEINGVLYRGTHKQAGRTGKSITTFSFPE
jgi:hypothetical protein